VSKTDKNVNTMTFFYRLNGES